MSRRRFTVCMRAGSLLVAWLSLLLASGCRPDVRPLDVESNLEMDVTGAKTADIVPGSANAAPRRGSVHPVVLAPAPAPGGIHVNGNGSSIACGTCHATRAADRSVRSSAVLNEFHEGLVYAHGELACVSCHDADNYDALRLADGRLVPYSEPMELCAQCHGPQMRDYLHGAHGGWNGHWDLEAGPRVRNQCTHCHDPHAPAFPRMQPTFKPKDRFLEPESYDGGSH
ncbi:MAG: hypothetical protein AAF581_21475 [Planctomycetota bacterium]